jgi:hypothetical protein
MAGALLVLWAALIAQAPDSAARARSGAAIRRMDDSLTVLEGTAAKFQADLVNASPDLVITRATRLREHCIGTRREAGRLDSLPTVQVRLGREIAALRSELARCDREFATGPWYQGADSVKAWAPYRLARLSEAVRRYRLAAREFMREASIN